MFPNLIKTELANLRGSTIENTSYDNNGDPEFETNKFVNKITVNETV